MASSKVDGVLQLLKKLDHGDLTGAKEILKKKVINVNLADVGGNTPLIVAARKGYNDIIDDLLMYENIDVNLANKNGRTPLFEAAEKGHKEIVRKLLSSPGIEVDKCNKRGSTPMIVAARNGFTDIVQDLFDKGANVDLADKTESKSTPLIEAAKNGRIETVRKLVLELGATLSKTDARGNNAIARAMRSSQSNQETILFLKEQEQFFLSNPQAPPVFEDLQRTPVIPQTDHSNGSASTGHGSGYMLLQTSPEHPKVVFCDESQEKVFSQDGGYFDFDNGIEVTVPPHTGPGSSKVVIKSRPGFVVKKNCVLPQGVRPASPSYFVSSEESEGSKRNGNYVITIEHHADEEVQKLVILQADSNPEKSGLDYVYNYKAVPKSNTEFLPGENKGKLTTSHITEPGKFFSVGVNCEAESGKKESECGANNNLYMVQIYRSPRQAEEKRAVVFVSLNGKAFLKSLRKKEEQWTVNYPGISTKPVDTTTMSGLKFVENDLTLNYDEVEGWMVYCDKTKISKISTENYDLENTDYPPKILCEFFPEGNAQTQRCSFTCTGLKGDPDFHVLLLAPKAKDLSTQTQVTSDGRNSTGVPKLQHSQALPCIDNSSKLEVISDRENQHLSVQAQPCTAISSKLEEVMKEVKSTAANLSTDADSSLVKSLKSLLDQISVAVQSSSLDDLAIQLSSIKSKVKALLRTLQKNPRYSDVKQLPEIEFRSSTLHQATKAKIMHCISQMHIEDALKELADRGEELLMAVKKVILEVLASDRAARTRRCKSQSRIYKFLVQHGYTDVHIDDICDDKHILEVCQKLPQWETLAFHLGLDEANVKTIKEDHKGNNELQKLYALREWRSHGLIDGTATYRVLIEALLKCVYTEVALELCRLKNTC